LRDPSTEFVEWPPVLVRGRRGPRRFAKVLPSEDGGGILERQGGDPLAHREGPSAIHGVTRPGAWPMRRHSLARGSNED
jgi:hypothetical protein